MWGAGAGNATEFIRFNPATKSFVVDDAAVQLLRKLSGPIAIVAVCGRARQVCGAVSAVLP